MIVAITDEGQITIPLQLRQQYHFNAGDQLEIDETAPVLTARRVVDRSEWEKALGDWQKSATETLKGHPWNGQPSSVIIDDLRGGPVETAVKERGCDFGESQSSS